MGVDAADRDHADGARRVDRASANRDADRRPHDPGTLRALVVSDLAADRNLRGDRRGHAYDETARRADHRRHRARGAGARAPRRNARATRARAIRVRAADAVAIAHRPRARRDRAPPQTRRAPRRAPNQFFMPIAALLMWTPNVAFAIERWRAEHGRSVIDWIDVVAEFE